MVQNFHEIAEKPMIKNFRDKNFVIATFLRDYNHATAPMQTIHVVAPPTIAHGLALSVKRKKLIQAFLSAFSAFCYCVYGHLFNVVVGRFDTRRRIRSSLDKGPCRFGGQRLLIY